MPDVTELIKEYMEDQTYQPLSYFDFEYEVRQVNGSDYEVYITDDIAEIIYIFKDVKYEDEDSGYSAYIDFISCKIESFEADINDYYVTKLTKYIEKCDLVCKILDSIDVFYNPEDRTYF